jgi:hypothetical protein
VRILSALAPLEAFAQFVRGKERRGLAILLRDPFLPEVDRLHDMGVG